MTQYRCYFFGTNGQLVGAETITQDSDDEARKTAMRLFAQRAFAVGFDLRQDRRSIAALREDRHEKTSAPHSIAA